MQEETYLKAALEDWYYFRYVENMLVVPPNKLKSCIFFLKGGCKKEKEE